MSMRSASTASAMTLSTVVVNTDCRSDQANWKRHADITFGEANITGRGGLATKLQRTWTGKSH